MHTSKKSNTGQKYYTATLLIEGVFKSKKYLCKKKDTTSQWRCPFIMHLKNIREKI